MSGRGAGFWEGDGGTGVGVALRSDCAVRRGFGAATIVAVGVGGTRRESDSAEALAAGRAVAVTALWGGAELAAADGLAGVEEVAVAPGSGSCCGAPVGAVVVAEATSSLGREKSAMMLTNSPIVIAMAIATGGGIRRGDHRARRIRSAALSGESAASSSPAATCGRSLGCDSRVGGVPAQGQLR